MPTRTTHFLFYKLIYRQKLVIKIAVLLLQLCCIEYLKNPLVKCCFFIHPIKFQNSYPDTNQSNCKQKQLLLVVGSLPEPEPHSLLISFQIHTLAKRININIQNIVSALFFINPIIFLNLCMDKLSFLLVLILWCDLQSQKSDRSLILGPLFRYFCDYVAMCLTQNYFHNFSITQDTHFLYLKIKQLCTQHALQFTVLNFKTFQFLQKHRIHVLTQRYCQYIASITTYLANQKNNCIKFQFLISFDVQ